MNEKQLLDKAKELGIIDIKFSSNSPSSDKIEATKNIFKMIEKIDNDPKLQNFINS